MQNIQFGAARAAVWATRLPRIAAALRAFLAGRSATLGDQISGARPAAQALRLVAARCPGDRIIGAGAAGCSVSQCAGIGGDVDGVLGKHCEGHDLKRPFMSGGQDHMGGRAIVMSSQPVSCCHAPAVPRRQPGELELRNRGRQIVADAALVLEEFSGHHGADRVASPVLWPGATAPITVEAGDRVGAAWLQFTTDHIAIIHRGSIRTSRRTRQASGYCVARPPGMRRSRQERMVQVRGPRSRRAPALDCPAGREGRAESMV